MATGRRAGACSNVHTRCRSSARGSPARILCVPREPDVRVVANLGHVPVRRCELVRCGTMRRHDLEPRPVHVGSGSAWAVGETAVVRTNAATTVTADATSRLAATAPPFRATAGAHPSAVLSFLNPPARQAGLLGPGGCQDFSARQRLMPLTSCGHASDGRMVLNDDYTSGSYRSLI